MVEDSKQIGDVTSYTDSAYYAGDNLDTYKEQLQQNKHGMIGMGGIVSGSCDG